MKEASEKPIRRREDRPADERRRFTVLILAAALLLLSRPFILQNVANKTLLAIAFLIPALQIGAALSDFDGLRSSLAVVHRSFVLEMLVFLFSNAIFLLTFAAEPSQEVWLLACCVYLIWGFLFHLGLGFATKLWLPNVYSVLSVTLAISKVKAAETEMSQAVWAKVLAPSLLAMVLMFIDEGKYGEAMFKEEVKVSN